MTAGTTTFTTATTSSLFSPLTTEHCPRVQFQVQTGLESDSKHPQRMAELETSV